MFGELHTVRIIQKLTYRSIIQFIVTNRKYVQYDYDCITLGSVATVYGDYLHIACS